MIIFLIAGAVFLIYYIVTLIAGGFSKFPLIWFGMGCVCTGLYFWIRHLHAVGRHVPFGVVWLCLCLIVMALLCVCAVELKIIFVGKQAPKPGADYVIILGAQVKGDRPSKALLRRIMAARDYLIANPDAKAILSGGQGPDEAISEAECMRRVLAEHGIREERLIIEDKSVNTLENLRFSLEKAGKAHRFVIATCDFHQLRAQAVARHFGVKEVSGIGCGSGHMLKVNDYFREFFALLKYDISGLI